jgi:hypothetical protein
MAWFKSAEVMLNLNGVRDKELWFYYVQWALTSQQKKLVDDIIALDPTPPDAYNILKGRLLSLYDKGQRDRYMRFRQLPPLGGQRPSELLAEMRALCPRGEEESNMFRYEFFFRLPISIQAHLGEDESSSTAELAARADALVAFAAKSTAPINAVDEEQEIAVVRDDNSKKRKFNPKRKKGKESGAAGGGGAPQSGPTEWEKLGLCYAHFRFGSDAYKKSCRPGCARAGN